MNYCGGDCERPSEWWRAQNRYKWHQIVETALIIIIRFEERMHLSETPASLSLVQWPRHDVLRYSQIFVVSDQNK